MRKAKARGTLIAPGLRLDYGQTTAPVIDRAMQSLRVKGLTETLAGVGVYVRESSGS